MHQSAISAFQSWTETQEGRLTYMYLDNLGLVTTAIGNLIDATKTNLNAPWTPALALPWKHGEAGAPATPNEIKEAWQAVKARQDLKDLGGGNSQFSALTDLRLSQKDIDDLFAKTLASNISILKANGFPNLDTIPADAQMGILGMAWALGPYFSKDFPKFTAAINSGNYYTAALESHISNGTVKRNAQQALMFANAGAVVKGGLDSSKLYFPGTATIAERTMLAVALPNVVAFGMIATIMAGVGIGYMMHAAYKRPVRRRRYA